MSRYLRQLPVLIIILIGAAAVPGRVSEIRTNWPVIRLWHDPGGQMAEMLGDVPYETLETAAQQLAPDVTVLLVTSGEDVRRKEYTAYHRALYMLTPRPVWWLSPAAPDGTWESRWWISRPLTAENVDMTAVEKSVDCLLLIDVPALPEYGVAAGQLPGGEIIQVGPENCLAEDGVEVVNYPVPFWPLRLLPALAIVLVFGFTFLVFGARLGGRISGMEALSAAWLLGAGLLSTAMFWLDGAGFSLSSQLLILTVGAAFLFVWRRKYVVRTLAALRSDVSSFRFDRARWRQTAVLLLSVFLLFQLVYIVLMAVGRPLTIWDSWVNWGSKGRTIFLENGITPALYADSSRQVMLLGYPISIPLLEAWFYGWLGTADDRLVGLIFVLTYLALGGFVYGFCRRQGRSPAGAVFIMGAAVSVGHVVGLAATAFTDLWLPALLVVAAVYLLEWMEGGRIGYLVIAAAASGLLTWVKQEGMILVIVLLLSLVITFLLCRGNKRNFQEVGAALILIGLGAGIFGVPWRLFAAREAALVSVFLPLSTDNLLANLDRIPVIIQLIVKELLNLRTGLIWPLTMVVLIVRWRQWPQMMRRPSILLLIVPVLYLGIMSIPYLFSDFVPYQQHILSSFFRINAHILLLPFVWIGKGEDSFVGDDE